MLAKLMSREVSSEIDLVAIFDGFSLHLHQKVCMAINLKRAVNFKSISKLQSSVFAEEKKTQNLGDVEISITR